jgi:hypothetical protein
MRVEFEPIIAYSPRNAAKAFDPSCGELAIRRAIKAGKLKTFRVGNRAYITRRDLLAWIKELQGELSDE